MTEQQGVLSLWVFTEKRENLDDSILEDEFGIQDFNEDLLEMGGADEWKELPITDVFSRMSVSESWADQAITKANELGITKCRRAFIILNFSYDPSVVSFLPKDPKFVGTFKFFF